MAFVPAGVDVALVASQRTPGRLNFVIDSVGPNAGNPRFTNDREHAVLTRLMSRRRGRAPGAQQEQGGYYWDATGLRGTLLWTIKLDRLATRSDLLAAADDAGQQLVNEKVIKTLVGSAKRVLGERGKWRLTISWLLPNGTQPTRTITV